MDTVTFKVGGMTCGHCQRRVEDALKDVDGVSKATVNLEKGEATIEYDGFKTNPDTLKKAVASAGYEV
ncbi:Copper chaperone CopZ [Methanimicrococcus hongohii]|uniref:Copper chaperone CopZ n=1 Tax=Methanimicrococcus hongohii TaxID=3028295 RepID=A0AA96ZSY6_9EURY|nr:heavy metal-associated domain-containing protein [Methanimicrococcus sp. Hf6]WNY23930.1 Copper chaperone CopZ [Methanimicrococcus sp. Hf6]